MPPRRSLTVGRKKSGRGLSPLKHSKAKKQKRHSKKKNASKLTGPRTKRRSGKSKQKQMKAKKYYGIGPSSRKSQHHCGAKNDETIEKLKNAFHLQKFGTEDKEPFASFVGTKEGSLTNSQRRFELFRLSAAGGTADTNDKNTETEITNAQIIYIIIWYDMNATCLGANVMLEHDAAYLLLRLCNKKYFAENKNRIFKELVAESQTVMTDLSSIKEEPFIFTSYYKDNKNVTRKKETKLTSLSKHIVIHDNIIDRNELYGNTEYVVPFVIKMTDNKFEGEDNKFQHEESNTFKQRFKDIATRQTNLNEYANEQNKILQTFRVHFFVTVVTIKVSSFFDDENKRRFFQRIIRKKLVEPLIIKTTPGPDITPDINRHFEMKKLFEYSEKVFFEQN